MIESFSLSNYMSYRDKTELSFLASKKEGGSELYPSTWYKEIGGKRILKLLIGVGLNASGKSKMISGLTYLQNIATTRPVNPNMKPLFRPFRLDLVSMDRPTEMWLDFYVCEDKYEYYVKISKDRIEEEELRELKFGASRSQRIFYRTHNLDTNTVEILFGQSSDMSKKDQRDLQVNIFSNCTVLSQFGFMNLESPQLRLVYDYFLNHISRVHQSDKSLAEKLQTGDDEHDRKMKSLLMRLLADIGSNIVDYHIESLNIGLSDLVDSGAPSIIIDMFKEQNPQGIYEQKVLMFDHRTPLGNRSLDSQSESKGTMDIIKLMVVLYDVIVGRKCTCIDELCDGLHPTALEYLLRTYLELSTDCQLIMMTHDLSLLAPSKIRLRRDAIRKFSKNESGVTTVTRQDYLHKTVSLYKKYMEELEEILPEAIKSEMMSKDYKSIIE